MTRRSCREKKISNVFKNLFAFSLLNVMVLLFLFFRVCVQKCISCVFVTNFLPKKNHCPIKQIPILNKDKTSRVLCLICVRDFKLFKISNKQIKNQ